MARFDSTTARQLRGLSSDGSEHDEPEVGTARRLDNSNARVVKANAISVLAGGHTAKNRDRPQHNNVPPNSQPPKRPAGRPGASEPSNPDDPEVPTASSLRRKPMTSIRPVIPAIALGRRNGQIPHGSVTSHANNVRTHQPVMPLVGPNMISMAPDRQAARVPASLLTQKTGGQVTKGPHQEPTSNWRKRLVNI